MTLRRATALSLAAMRMKRAASSPGVPKLMAAADAAKVEGVE